MTETEIPRTSRLVRIALAATLLAGGLAGSSYLLLRQRPSSRVGVPVAVPARVVARRSVAVLGFRNLSARAEDAWLSTAFAEMLNTELAAGEKLRLVPSEDVARAKLDLPLADSDTLSKDTLARIRTNLGTDYVILGSYTTVGRARVSVCDLICACRSPLREKRLPKSLPLAPRLICLT